MDRSPLRLPVVESSVKQTNGMWSVETKDHIIVIVDHELTLIVPTNGKYDDDFAYISVQLMARARGLA